MGKHFGNLQKIKGVTYYSLSPYELKPFKGCINPGIMNLARRFRGTFFYIAIPMFVAYATALTVNDLVHQSERKNPDDFKNDV